MFLHLFYLGILNCIKIQISISMSIAMLPALLNFPMAVKIKKLAYVLEGGGGGGVCPKTNKGKQGGGGGGGGVKIAKFERTYFLNAPILIVSSIQHFCRQSNVFFEFKILRCHCCATTDNSNVIF